VKRSGGRKLVLKKLTLLLLGLVVALGMLAVACGSDDDGPNAEPDPVADRDPVAEGDPTAGAQELDGDLIIYSGRREPLFEPVVAAFEEATGIDVSVKYGSTAELGNALIEEKNNARADLFSGTDAATAEQLRSEGVFAPFDDPALTTLPDGFHADDGSWVGVSGRARVIMYNTEALTEADLPQSVFDLTDEKWKGKVAMPATTNSSFTAWVSSLRKLKGDEETEAFLQGLKDNDITVLREHTDVRQAVGSGEFELGLVNHYYYQLEKEAGSPVGVIYPDQEPGGIGVLVNVAAASIVAGAAHEENAIAFMKFLLSEEAQTIFAETNFEYPLVEGVTATRADKPRGSFTESAVSLTELGAMNESTLDLIDGIGLE
jgi:iron(III) transport system substrate-binding protein